MKSEELVAKFPTQNHADSYEYYQVTINLSPVVIPLICLAIINEIVQLYIQSPLKPQ